MTKPSEIVSLLLNDEQLASLDQSGGLAAANQASSKTTKNDKKDGDNMGDFWNEEGDDFFGAAGPSGEKGGDEEGGNAAPTETPTAKKRRSKATGAPRGRKPGKKKTDATSTPTELASEM